MICSSSPKRPRSPKVGDSRRRTESTRPQNSPKADRRESLNNGRLDRHRRTTTMEASVERCLTELQREKGALGCERAPCSFLDCLKPLLAAALDRNGGRTELTSGVRTSAEDIFHSIVIHLRLRQCNRSWRRSQASRKVACPASLILRSRP